MPEPQSFDPYSVLGIERGVSSLSIEVLDKAYEQKKKQCHPDRNQDPEATAIHRAYTELKKQMSRNEVDSKSTAFCWKEVQVEGAGDCDLFIQYAEAGNCDLLKIDECGCNMLMLCDLCNLFFLLLQ